MLLLFILQNALNITSKLLEDLGEMQSSELNANILVSCDKLEKFALQYAELHMTSLNDSEAEISIEQQEIGEAFDIFLVPESLTQTLIYVILRQDKSLWLPLTWIIQTQRRNPVRRRRNVKRKRKRGMYLEYSRPNIYYLIFPGM